MAIKLRVEADDKASQKLQGVEGEVKKLGRTTQTIGQQMEARWKRLQTVVSDLAQKFKRFAIIGIGAVMAGMTKAVMMSSKQETAFKRLEIAVDLVGASYAQSKPRITAFLDEMQATTRFGDDELAPILQEIVQLTGSLEKGFSGTKLAADMAASGLFNLDQASRMVAMVMEGEVTLLGRYIPQLKESALAAAGVTTAAQKTEYALRLLNEKFGGAAIRDMETFGGTWASFKNYLGDVIEKIGDLIAIKLKPTIDSWVEKLKEWIKSGDMEVFVTNLISLFSGLEKAVGFVVEKIGKIVKFAADKKVENLRTEIEIVRKNMDALESNQGLNKVSNWLNFKVFGDEGDRTRKLDALRQKYKELTDQLNELLKPIVQIAQTPAPLANTGARIAVQSLLQPPGGAPGMSRRTRETTAPGLSTGSLDETIDKLKKMEDVGKESAFSVGDAWRNSMQDMASFVGDEWSREFTDLVGKGKTFFGQLWRFVLQSFTRMLATMAAQWAAMFLTKTILNWIVPGSGTAFEKAVQGGSASMRTPQSQQVLNSSRPRQSSVVMQGDNFVVNGGDPGLAKELKLLKARNNEFLRTQIETLARQRQLSYIGI